MTQPRLPVDRCTKPSEPQLQWGIKIPMRDGIELSATLYLPLNKQRPSPTIFVLTPYVAQVHHEQGVFYASHGYPFLAVDTRGRGNSGGDFRPRGEALDGHDIVEWIARQPYCNGKVTMWGGSYSGYVQWATAGTAPPHLATMVPVASPYRGVDSPVRNNVFPTYLIQWLTYLTGRTAQDRIFADRPFWNAQFKRWFEAGRAYRELDSAVGNPLALFQEWVSHPHPDEYWDSYNPKAGDYAKLSIPILSITGSYDGDQLGSLAHYRQHLQNATAEARARHYLIMGPWDHSGTRTPKLEFSGLEVGPASLVDISQLHLDWYAWTMEQGPKPQFLQKNVAYYVIGADQWRYADTLEAVTAREQPFFLQSQFNPNDVHHSGSLKDQPLQHCEPDWYVYDPRDVSLAELESTLDPFDMAESRMVYARRGQQLVYHSAPFAEDLEVSGFFRASLWLAIDQPDTDFRVTVYEIGLDGRSVQIGADWMRARYRQNSRKEILINTHEPLRYDFERFMFMSRLIKRGCRLRLVIGPINSIYSQKNYNSGGVVSEESMKDARAVTVKLFHDAEHPSALYVPIGQVGND